jgi:uracil-DNA glycosylase family 4
MMMLFSGEPPRMKGFTSVLPRCEACKLYKKCRSPKIPVSGDGRRGILIVGEAPGPTDDRKNRHFTGEQGQIIARELTRNGLNLRKDCWLTSSIICHSGHSPTVKQIEYCRPNLLGVIKRLKPKVIILLGGAATQAVIPHLWKSNDSSIDRWAGWTIPARDFNAWVCPTHSTLSLLQWGDKPIGRAVSGQFARHIAAAVSHEEHPYGDTIPSEQDDVEIIYDVADAADAIREETQQGGLVSFDYETTMLKPDGPKAQIVSCAVCFRGERTIAYPWYGDAIKATKELLRSRLPKVGANIKFEQRWTMAKLGVEVRNFVWDAMQAAHVLDCRRGVTSVKFQAFVRLGTPIWDEGVKRYLVSDGPSIPNNIWKCPLPQLLLYNGVDSLVEYRLALEQSQLLGIPLEVG